MTAYEQKGDFAVCNHLRARNFSLQALCIPTSATDLRLTRGSQSNIILTGDVPGQIVTLTDATDCLEVGHEYCIFNDSETNITVRDFSGDVLVEIIPGASCCLVLKDNLTPGGVWLGKAPQLSKILIDTSSVSGVSGDNSQEFIFNYLEIAGIPIKNEVAGGSLNCNNLLFTILFEAIPGTIEVWLDGNKLENGVDYLESVDNKGFTILLDPNDRNRLHSAPKDNERITVSYCRRVIF